MEAAADTLDLVQNFGTFCMKQVFPKLCGKIIEMISVSRIEGALEC